MSRPFPHRLVIVFAAFTAPSGIGGTRAKEILHVGFQKSSILLTLIRSQGTFERELTGQGIRVSQYEFSSNLPLLEPLNVDNVDLSADVTDTVPVFTQAAGVHPTYFTREMPPPMAQAILVDEHPPLKSLAELKGKRIVVTKAAGSHYLLIAALASAGFEFSDIQSAYLTPVDGHVAFENGKVGAQVIWDSHVASAQCQQHARVLVDSQGLASHQRYYFASSNYAGKYPEVPQQVSIELQCIGRWLKSHPADAAKVSGSLQDNLDAATIEQTNARRSYDIQLVGADGLDEQQCIVDAFHAQGLLPKLMNTRTAEVWQPQH